MVPSKRTKLLKQTRGRCWYCGVALGTQQATIDHKIPKSRGGSSQLLNLVIACRTCNNRKGQLTTEEYRTELAGEGRHMGALSKLRDVLREFPQAENWTLQEAVLNLEGMIPSITFYGERGGLRR